MNLYRKVLAAVDLGDPDSATRVIQSALEVIADQDTLHVVSVVPDYGTGVVASFFPPGHEKEAINKARDALHAFTAENVPEGVPVQHVVGHGSVYGEIVAIADKLDADLIVIGSHRPRLRDHLLGPNAERVVRHASQSVLVARGDK